MAEAITYTAEDLDTVVRTVWGEARNQGVAGWIAVAWVIRNRASWQPPAWWGHTLSEVCTKPWQFSCWLAGDPNSAKLKALPNTDSLYLEIEDAVLKVFSGAVPDPTGGATNYEVIGTNAKWAQNRTACAIIGAHEFYFVPPNG